MRAIDADALLEIIEREEKYLREHGANERADGILDAFMDIQYASTIEPERKKGKWLPDNNSVYEMRFVCSECRESEVVPTIGFTKYVPIWNFCPNCGADMRGE